MEKNNTSKLLVLECLPIFSHVVAVRVLEQTHRGKKFGVSDNIFIASNGYYLISAGRPQFINNINTKQIYVLGCDYECDDDIILMESNNPTELITYLKTAVREYNVTFSNDTNNNSQQEHREGKEYKSKILI